MLPFAGGLYGYVRCGMGPTVGFLVGCSESLRYVLFIAGGVAVIGNILSELSHSGESLHPLWWLVFYAFALPIHIIGGRTFWTTVTVLGAISLALILIFCLASLEYHHKIPPDQVSFSSPRSLDDFNTYFATARLFFLGTDVLTVASGDVRNSIQAVPRALIAVIATGIITAFSLLLATAALPPGPVGLASQTYPLLPGFEQMLQVPAALAPILSLPGAVGNAFGFLAGCGRQIRSMAGSGLLPEVLQRSYTGSQQNTPIAGLLGGSLLSYLVLLVVYHTMPEDYIHALFHMCMCSSSVAYMCLLRSYIIFSTRYSNIERPFRSPLGVYGAVYGIVILGYVTVTVFFLDKTNPKQIYRSFYLYMAFLVLAFVYYALVARRFEFFSQEEQDRFMKAYILNGKHCALCSALCACLLPFELTVGASANTQKRRSDKKKKSRSHSSSIKTSVGKWLLSSKKNISKAMSNDNSSKSVDSRASAAAAGAVAHAVPVIAISGVAVGRHHLHADVGAVLPFQEEQVEVRAPEVVAL